MLAVSLCNFHFDTAKVLFYCYLAEGKYGSDGGRKSAKNQVVRPENGGIPSRTLACTREEARVEMRRVCK
jgi:hypothetical protein